MSKSKEYYLKLQEEEFESLPFEEQSYLNRIGMEVRQKETEHEELDEHYQKLKKVRVKSWNDEQEYLFKKRNKMQGS